MAQDWDLAIREEGISPNQLVCWATAARARYLNLMSVCEVGNQIAYTHLGDSAISTKELERIVFPYFWKSLISICDGDFQKASLVFIYAFKEEKALPFTIDFSRTYRSSCQRSNASTTIAEEERMLENIRNVISKLRDRI